MTFTTDQSHATVNGIDTLRVIELATSMAQDEGFGRFRFRADNTWIDGTRSRSSIQGFFAGGEERNERSRALLVDADQPSYLGGGNSAPNAVEHYLNALSGCLTTTLIAHASVQGHTIESLDVAAEGHMDARGFFGVSPDVARGFTRIQVTMRIKGDINEDAVRAMVSYSPVFEMASKSTPVEMHISIERTKA